MVSRLALLLLLVVGCAKAGKDFVSIGGGDDMVDGGFGRGDDIDAPPRPDGPPHIDAPMGGGGGISSTLTETNDTNNSDNDRIFCEDNFFGGSLDMTYYRIFQPSLSGITTEFDVTSVTFGVWAATGANNISVSVGTYTGQIDQNLDLGMVTNLATQEVNAPDTGSGENVNVGINATIPAGGTFVVSVAVPDLSPDGFALGMSEGGETHPGYLSSDACEQPVAKTSDVGPGALLLAVTGSH